MKFDLSSMIATRADRASNLIKKCFLSYYSNLL